LATQIIARVREAYQVEMPLRTLFERPTVATLAEYIQERVEADTNDYNRIAELLNRLDSLSPLEAKELLENA
jgi:hypothetical protein